MAAAKWKFTLVHSEGVLGDVADAFRASGFSFSESVAAEEAFLDTGELHVSFKKDSAIDPWTLLQNLEQASVKVVWKNKPAR